MKPKFSLSSLLFFTLVFFFASCIKPPLDHECNGVPDVKVSLFATGLNNPRGLEFGPDGNLYVAEGGTGGTDSSVGQCEQVPAPIGPYRGSKTGGRISKITPEGVRTTVTDKLPSASDQMGDVVGVGDIAFIGNTMYAAITGGGCSHGVPSFPNSVIKVNADGSWSQVADLSRYLKTHPVAHPEEDDFEPDGDWYSMISVGNDLYAVEANHGELVRITTSGQVSRVVDVSASQGHVVPTVVAHRNGNFYLGNLDTFPAPPGGSKIFQLSPGGSLQTWASGFNMILGIAFDSQGRLYVLEMTVGAPFPTPGKGMLVRIDQAGQHQTIATGLTFPTGLTMGPDDNLYVSANGLGPTSIGGGQVLKIKVRDCGSYTVNHK